MICWGFLTAVLCGAIIYNEYCGAVSDLPNAVMAAVAVLALFGAALQIQESKRSAATAIYAEYLKLAIENPQYAIPNGVTGARSSERSSGSTYDSKYSFYVSYLLLAAEEILETQHGDKEWEVTLKAQLAYHKNFIDESGELYANDGSRAPMYSSKLMNIYKKVNSRN